MDKSKLNEALLAEMLGLKDIPKKTDERNQSELKPENLDALPEIKEPLPVKEKLPSFFSYRQELKSLEDFLKEYYSEIHPITGKPQTVEEYIFELITDARNDLRRGNYFDKKTQLEFVEELENYLLTWQKKHAPTVENRQGLRAQGHS